ncbi:hypothetical protein DFJ58DRAFT_776689 [Suillus subalutaceus]|uniref:uncharacterized protein n=1 Tax=Suillus subalutaceus TaxID=48586 RepID=UPI001B85BE2C|nr:uncharacterized protein DFJ58DRAFT_776689 [Suillus subalutaceus]KAG1861714.1 hypothetical protein DFJ58DRAFT_776689 [Suillus subalutaceus]
MSATTEPSVRPRRWLAWYGPQRDGTKEVARPTLHLDTGLASSREECEQSEQTIHSADPGASCESGLKTSRPSTPRRNSISSLSHLLSLHSSPHSSVSHLQQDDQASPQNAASSSSTISAPLASAVKSPELTPRSAGSFGKISFNSMMGGLSALSLSRTITNEDKDKETRGRKRKPRSSSFLPKNPIRARSSSPFSLRRFRPRDRDASPAPLPLEDSDCDSVISRRLAVRPRNAFTDDMDSGSEYAGEETEDEEDDWSEDGMFDFVTERNTEQNALIAAHEMSMGELDPDDVTMDPDPLGEGVNVVVPPEPYFPSTLNRSSFTSKGKRGAPKRKKSRHHETLPLKTDRPLFQRDRCTITMTQGDPEASGRRRRMYIVASDLSEESRYAVEWGIGTVVRDGDHLLIVTVVENESKVDPPIPNQVDRTTRLRSQQERQGLAYILVRQATSLLQRTHLHVTVSCQAWHSKNARHMLLDIVDYNEPTMLIVGSRGLGQIKGILLGSTSHYLIQRCSVPVMVARRRLKRPPKRSAHLAKNRMHVSLAEAGIDRVVPKVDQDVAVMRDEMQRDDDRRGKEEERDIDEDGEEPGEEGEGDGAEGEGYLGTKVGG